MSLFNWFSTRKHPDHADSALPSSGLSRLESTKPFNGHARMSNQGGAQPANRKQERMERREMLYGVVREAMVRAGVLSSSYKFKVLSLDTRGSQFLVMVDLAYGGGADTNRLAEIEAMVAQSAKARYDIVVTAVYWRANDHVAVGDPAHRPPISRPAPLTEMSSRPASLTEVSRPAPLSEVSRPAPLGATSRPAPLASAPAPLAASVQPPESRAAVPVPAATAAATVTPAASKRVDPLQEDEVAAFKKALDAGLRGEKALAGAAPAKGTQQSYTLLTGFEDTEMTDGAGELSGTQYGALR